MAWCTPLANPLFTPVIHPQTEIKHISDVMGYGVFATAFIPAGTLTYVKDSLELEIGPARYDSLDPASKALVDKYSFRDENGIRVVSWDFAKYVNHCCHCNTMSSGYGFEIAIRDIYPGEQLTDEYGIFNIDEEIRCECSAPNCRGKVSPDDFDTFFTHWDQQLRAPLAKVFELPQPLAVFLDQATLDSLRDYTDNGVYRSVYHLKYHPVNGHAYSA